MYKILILVMCSMHVKKWRLVSFIGMMDFCFRKINCVPICSLCELLVREAHGGSLMRHFGVAKTLGILHKYIFWSHMKRDAERICEKCITCKQAKSKLKPHELFTLCIDLVNLGLTFLWILF